MGLANKLYYLLKPFLPLSARYALRRIRAHYKLRSATNWPIAESAGTAPERWPGWPHGKRFAVVLTHDVEGQIGVDRTLRLAKMEAELGFRSSFNFIPEGDYRVSGAMREHLSGEGFEIGVHDLHHDGSLYKSRAAFLQAAPKINQYLREWGAAGFRAGFMFHNLEWLKQLDIEYDASTFDVDPFEAQPDGVGTIFPFWMPKGREGHGYVELPYTLVQDSTLFLILRHQTIELWKKKVDWIVEKGGMVLLNLHPDYVGFDSRRRGISEFAPALYESFLVHIREEYAGAYWHALPRDVARFLRAGITAYRQRIRPCD